MKNRFDWSQIDFNSSRGSGNQIYTLCPVCSHTRKKKTDKCLGINVSEGKARCNHCEAISFKEGGEKNHIMEKKEYILPKPTNITALDDNVVKWFKDRGISQKTLIEDKITNQKEWMPQTGKETNVIVFPYYVNGILANLKYRDGDKNFKLHKGSKLIFQGLDSVKNEKSCFIVEGEMDRLSLLECGITNVLSVPNGTSLSPDEKKLIETKGKFNDANLLNLEFLDNSIEYLEHIEEFILFVDNDPAGRKLQRELIRRLSPEKCKTVDSKECKDANDYLVKYNTIELEGICKGAKNVPLDGVFTVDDEWNYIKDIYENGYKKGKGIGSQKFDAHRKFRLGELDLITGVPNHGKTTYISWEMALTHLHFGWKWGIYSPENYPAGEIYITLIETISGKSLDSDTNKISLEELEHTKERIADNFFVIDWDEEDAAVTVDMVLAKTKELIKRKGINGMLIDPWNDLYHKKEAGENVADYLQRTLSKIRRFKRKYNMKFVINAHPTADAQRKKEKHTEQGERPYVCWFFDVDGGAMWGNRVDNALTIYRNTPHETAFKTTEVHIQKVKFQKLTGIPTSQDDPIKMNFVNERLIMQDGFDPLKPWTIKNEPKVDVFESATANDFENSVFEGQPQEVNF